MVHGFIPVALAALASFVATNTDDFISLVVFYAQVDKNGERHALAVAVGQILGFTLLNAVCLLGLVLGKFIPTDYLGLIGFLPLLNGIYKLSRVLPCCPCARRRTARKESSLDGPPISSEEERANLLDEETAPSSSGYNTLEEEPSEEPTMSPTSPRPHPDAVVSQSYAEAAPGCASVMCGAMCRWASIVFDRRSLAVALVVIGDGGDSISSTLPLFATENPAEILLTLAIFYALTFVIVVVAYLMFRLHVVGRFMGRYGKWIRPVLLIALGIYILSDSVLGHMVIRLIKGGDSNAGGDDGGDDDDDPN